MAPRRHAFHRGFDQRDLSGWSFPLKLMWITLLAAVCFLMAHDMVQHDFFSGGVLNNRISHLRY